MGPSSPPRGERGELETGEKRERKIRKEAQNGGGEVCGQGRGGDDDCCHAGCPLFLFFFGGAGRV